MNLKPLVLTLLILFMTAAAAGQQSVALSVEKIRTEPVPLQTGEYADVWVKIENDGDATARNAVVEFVPTFPFSTDPDERTRWDLGKLPPEQEYHIRTQVRVDANAVHGTNDLVFRTTANDVSVRHDVPVEVRTDDAALVVSSVSFPDTVRPGTTRTLNLTLRNRADSHLKNIETKIDLSAETLPFATAETTRKRVQSLEPDAATTVTYKLHVDEEAENGVYKLPLTLTYEDEAGTAFTKDVQTGVVVGGRVDLDIAVQERDLMEAGTTGTVTLRVVNRGEGRARFARMTLGESESFERISTSSIYLGDMQADDFQTAEYQLHANADAESLELPVTVAYKDAQGAQTFTEDVTVDLYDAATLQRFNLDGNRTPWPILIVAVLVVAGAVYWWRRR